MFSDREKKIIKIVGDKNLSIQEINVKLFKDDIPLNSNILVANSVNRIIKKCQYFKLDWTLNKKRDRNMIIVAKVKK